MVASLGAIFKRVHHTIENIKVTQATVRQRRAVNLISPSHSEAIAWGLCDKYLERRGSTLLNLYSRKNVKKSNIAANGNMRKNVNWNLRFCQSWRKESAVIFRESCTTVSRSFRGSLGIPLRSAAKNRGSSAAALTVKFLIAAGASGNFFKKCCNPHSSSTTESIDVLIHRFRVCVAELTLVGVRSTKYVTGTAKIATSASSNAHKWQ